MDMINLTISLCDEQLLYYIDSQSSQKEVFLVEEDPFNSALGSLKFKSTTYRDKLDSLLPLQGINSQMSPVKRRSPSFKSGGKQNVKPIQAKVRVGRVFVWILLIKPRVIFPYFAWFVQLRFALLFCTFKLLIAALIFSAGYYSAPIFFLLRRIKKCFALPHFAAFSTFCVKSF